MIEDNYTEEKSLVYAVAKYRKPVDGIEIENWFVNPVDDSKLTERERLITILPVIIYEVEHDMLTEELSDELYLYFEDLQAGRLDGIFESAEEEKTVKDDLTKAYKQVFEE